jgi:hypothetical protein
MSESFRSSPPQQQWSSPNGNGHQGDAKDEHRDDEVEGAEVGRALVVGLLGGLLSGLPDEQKDRINGQVRTLVQQRISELRQNFNI